MFLFLRKLINFFTHICVYALVKLDVHTMLCCSNFSYDFCRFLNMWYVVFNLIMRGPPGSALYACGSVFHTNVDVLLQQKQLHFVLMKLCFFDFTKCDSQFVVVTLLCIFDLHNWCSFLSFVSNIVLLNFKCTWGMTTTQTVHVLTHPVKDFKI